jgi:hypothetical protein
MTVFEPNIEPLERMLGLAQWWGVERRKGRGYTSLLTAKRIQNFLTALREIHAGYESDRQKIIASTHQHFAAYLSVVTQSRGADETIAAEFALAEAIIECVAAQSRAYAGLARRLDACAEEMTERVAVASAEAGRSVTSAAPQAEDLATGVRIVRHPDAA